MNNNLPEVILSVIYHRHKHWIAVCCKPIAELNTAIKTVPDRSFSYTHKKWLIPYSKNHYITLKKALMSLANIKEEDVRVFAKAQKKIATNNQPSTDKKVATTIAKTTQIEGIFAVHPANKQVFVEMKQYLQLKSYSISTQKTYLNELSQF